MLKKLIKSFGYAIKGMVLSLGEQNMRIHLLAIAVVTTAGIFLDLSASEWAIIALTIGFVISAEMVNTAIEDLVDLVSPERNPKAGGSRILPPVRFWWQPLLQPLLRYIFSAIRFLTCFFTSYIRFRCRANISVSSS